MSSDTEKEILSDIYSNRQKDDQNVTYCDKKDLKNRIMLSGIFFSLLLIIVFLLLIVVAFTNGFEAVNLNTLTVQIQKESTDWSGFICFTCTNGSDVRTNDVHFIHIGTSWLCCLKEKWNIRRLLQLVNIL